MNNPIRIAFRLFTLAGCKGFNFRIGLSILLLFLAIISIAALETDAVATKSRQVILSLISELQAENWQVHKLELKDTWRIDGPIELGSPAVIIRLFSEKSQVVAYVQEKKKVPLAERPAVLAWMCKTNESLLDACFEMDLADGDLRCRAGLDFQDTALDQASLERIFHAVVASWHLYRSSNVGTAGSDPSSSVAKPSVVLLPELARIDGLFKQIDWPASRIAGSSLWQTKYRSKRGEVRLLVQYIPENKGLLIQAYPENTKTARRALAIVQIPRVYTWLAAQNYGLHIGYFSYDFAHRVIAFRLCIALDLGPTSAQRLKTGLMLSSLTVLEYPFD